MTGPMLPAPTGGRASRTPPMVLFATMVAIALASLGPAALVLSGAGRLPVATSEPTATRPPSATAAATATVAATTVAGGVRVTSTRGSSRPIATGRQHEVTFEWTIEGAKEGDEVAVQVYAGNRPLGQTSGPLDPSVFSFSTGTFRLTATLDCSTNGWSAEILTVHGQPVAGDGEATVPAVTCP